ncbi:hypothetical protein EVAR_22818_1 [Eumeta japonica]|uniref:Uncharacterized protein n=1 Tax=Eumeta variegata TaxID=151549 RepID=A0A4C1VGC5_EUMVA|nr:hypothetical protein EVAR_22818_1 [Eumeta japonica]
MIIYVQIRFTAMARAVVTSRVFKHRKLSRRLGTRNPASQRFSRPLVLEAQRCATTTHPLVPLRSRAARGPRRRARPQQRAWNNNRDVESVRRWPRPVRGRFGRSITAQTWVSAAVWTINKKLVSVQFVSVSGPPRTSRGPRARTGRVPGN